MRTDEFVPLSTEAVRQLLERRSGAALRDSKERRHEPRWPFPGPVELWVPAEDGEHEYVLATCRDLSIGGVGIHCERELAVGLTLDVAIHQPEVTLHGRATVRHCMHTHGGYLIGLEFLKD